MVRFPPDVQAALDASELWRAKQLVGGRINSANRYDASLYEQYGVILMRMGDLVLAGKYLFLSGKRDAIYTDAIELFIRQHGRGGWRTMVGTFPNAVRRMPIEELPQPLRDDYADFNVPPTAYTAGEPKESPVPDRAGCILGALVMIALAIWIAELIHAVDHWVLSLFK